MDDDKEKNNQVVEMIEKMLNSEYKFIQQLKEEPSYHEKRSKLKDKV